MKTYKQLMEVMSMTDMNKITGGDEAQRKLAQERQRKREAKAKGFDPNKSVMADGSKPSEESKVKEPVKPTKASAAADPLAKASSITKPNAITKREAQSDPLAKAANKKPDLRKSQLGKWSQGTKTSPSNLAKKAEDSIRKEPAVKKVDVKVDPSDESKTGKKPGTTRPIKKDNSLLKNLPKKSTPTKSPKPGKDDSLAREKFAFMKDKEDYRRSRDAKKDAANEAAAKKKARDAKIKGIKDTGKKALNLAKGLASKVKNSADGPGVGVAGETDHSGLQGRNKGVGN